MPWHLSARALLTIVVTVVGGTFFAVKNATINQTLFKATVFSQACMIGQPGVTIDGLSGVQSPYSHPWFTPMYGGQNRAVGYYTVHIPFTAPSNFDPVNGQTCMDVWVDNYLIDAYLDSDVLVQYNGSTPQSPANADFTRFPAHGVTFTSGSQRNSLCFRGISQGTHTLTIRAWNNDDNSQWGAGIQFCPGANFCCSVNSCVQASGVTCNTNSNPSPDYLCGSTTACLPPGCGNTIVDSGEACDPTAAGWTSATCTSTCQLTNRCGDGSITSGEQCDDGNAISGDGCSATCQTEGPPSNCTETAVPGGVWKDSCGDSCTTYAQCGPSFGGSTCTSSPTYLVSGVNIPTPQAGYGCSVVLRGEAYRDIYDISWGGTNIFSPPAIAGSNTAVSTNLISSKFWPTNVMNAFSVKFPVTVGSTNTLSFKRTTGNSGAGFINMNAVVQCCQLCGNGVRDTGEECDTGISADVANGCTAACTNHCGDGSTQPNGATSSPSDDETCDNGTANSNTSSTTTCTTLCKAPRCGDGHIQPGGPDGNTTTDTGDENCDDGNTNSGDGCSAACIAEVCGDGVRQNAETCDNGLASVFGAVVTSGGNGSTTTNACRLDCTLPVCGDGARNAGESCDQVSPWSSIPGSCLNISGVCTIATCGDGIVSSLGATTQASDDEECEIGVGGYTSQTCSGPNANSSLACKKIGCGDKIIQAALGETCDNGNSTLFPNVTLPLIDGGNGYGLTQTCTPLCGRPVCGDTYEQTAGSDGILSTTANNEYCDNGTATNPKPYTNGNANTEACTLNCKKAVCGDGYTQPAGADNFLTTAPWSIANDDEQCDAGSNNNDATSACTTKCKFPRCGDAITQLGGPDADISTLAGNEQCDLGNSLTGNGTAGASCSIFCRWTGYCGDGITQIGGPDGDPLTNPTENEVCDDGNTINTDACTNTCKAPVCGDAIVQPKGPDNTTASNPSSPLNDDEQCDLGSGVNNNTGSCTTMCKTPRCGDTFTQPGGPDGNLATLTGNEACDDGNTVTTDACISCQFARCGDGMKQTGVEACDDGNQVETDACTTLCVNATCGDGHLQPNGATTSLADNEVCDDGNTVNGDGCSSVCKPEACGDGVVGNTPGEQCDETNTVNTDKCTTACLWARCGDPYVQPLGRDGQSSTTATSSLNLDNEQCDLGDGNNSNTGTCTLSCKTPICGDTFTQPSNNETCDDGNTVTTDACIACKVATCGDGNVQTGVEQCDRGTTGTNPNSNTSTTTICTTLCRTPRCGDSFIQTGGPDGNVTTLTGNENCDDGNTLNGDGCSSICKAEICGDGVPGNSLGEECDDGNTIVDDACNACVLARCGDSITQVKGSDNIAGNTDDEQCDDGNTVNTDNCTNSCLTKRCGDGFAQPGEQCDDGNVSNTDTCHTSCVLTRCGDSITQPKGIDDTAGTADDEQCDDGNTINTDACTNACKQPGCGDSIVQVKGSDNITGTADDEQCDDGNIVNDDTCSNSCKTPRCGDQIIQAGEQCDDGNTTNTDTCTNTCQAARCGDTFLQAGEQCDDGNTINTDGCLTTCISAQCGDNVTQLNGADNIAGTADDEQCDDANAINVDGCTNACKLPRCGDFILQQEGVDQLLNTADDEQCDDGNTVNTDFCTNACKVPACGDSIVQSNEQCDLGIANSNTGTCTLSCRTAVCGDGFTQGTEQCDDGNTTNVDSCTNTCTLPRCGDTILQQDGIDLLAGTADDEQCDDGNTVNTDFCTNTCKAPVCGDTIVQSNEQCDDGNSTNDDACSNTCYRPVCGDGIIQPKGIDDIAGNIDDEQCDDANTINTDACTTSCKSARCGDTIVQPSGIDTIAGNIDDEQCDDGNSINNDACSNACKQSGCGDGIVQAGEQCDDGTLNILLSLANKPFAELTDADIAILQRSSCMTSCTVAQCSDGVDNDGLNGADTNDGSCRSGAFGGVDGAWIKGYNIEHSPWCGIEIEDVSAPVSVSASVSSSSYFAFLHIDAVTSALSSFFAPQSEIISAPLVAQLVNTNPVTECTVATQNDDCGSHSCIPVNGILTCALHAVGAYCADNTGCISNDCDVSTNQCRCTPASPAFMGGSTSTTAGFCVSTPANQQICTNVGTGSMHCTTIPSGEEWGPNCTEDEYTNCRNAGASSTTQCLGQTSCSAGYRCMYRTDLALETTNVPVYRCKKISEDLVLNTAQQLVNPDAATCVSWRDCAGNYRTSGDVLTADPLTGVWYPDPVKPTLCIGDDNGNNFCCNPNKPDSCARVVTGGYSVQRQCAQPVIPDDPIYPPPICGNNVIEAGESCDGGSCCNSDCTSIFGCTTACNVAGALQCPNICLFSPVCGNEIIEMGEQCDDGPLGSATCSTACETIIPSSSSSSSSDSSSSSSESSSDSSSSSSSSSTSSSTGSLSSSSSSSDSSSSSSDSSSSTSTSSSSSESSSSSSSSSSVSTSSSESSVISSSVTSSSISSSSSSISSSASSAFSTPTNQTALIFLASDRNPSQFGELVTFTAEMSPVQATGTVTFTIDGTVVRSTSLVRGVAVYALNTLAVGSHDVIASYSGDSVYAPATSSLLVQVVLSASSSAPNTNPSSQQSSTVSSAPIIIATNPSSSSTSSVQTTTKTTQKFICGNGKVDAGEECDDRNTVDADGCSSRCLLERGFCGDGRVQYGLGEQCDLGASNGLPNMDCDIRCAYVKLPSCGDGVTDPATELCDAGLDNGNFAGARCRDNCMLPRCGDGIRDGVEECDDGNNLSSDACSAECTIQHRAAEQPVTRGELIDTTPRAIPTPAHTATGPGLVIFLVTGAAAGIGLMRRRL